jgi:uncharacterized protein
MNTFPQLPDGFTALITGASSGLGAEMARQVATEARVLILVARRLDRLGVLKEELTLQHPDLHVYLCQVDLNDPKSIEQLLDYLKDKSIAVDFLINNAGLGDLGTFQSSDWPRVRSMLLVNIEALTALTHALLPGMLRRGKGAILNVASTAGFLPLPTFAVYGATKAYVCSFSEALAVELRQSGVTVTSLCPGPVSTEFGEVATRPNSRRKFAPVKALYVPAVQVVREALDGVRRRKVRVIPGGLVRAGALFLEFIPTPVKRFFLRWADRFSGPEKPVGK